MALAKIHLRYDLELMDSDLDWEGKSNIHIQWWKPKLMIRLSPCGQDTA